jgi:hypothetical protein
MDIDPPVHQHIQYIFLNELDEIPEAATVLYNQIKLT